MKFLRRKYYIYPELQKPLVKFVLLSIVFVSVVQSILVFASMRWLQMKTQVDLSIVVDHRVFGPWKMLLYFSVIIPMIMNLFLGFCFILFVSNKFAGPLFRLERELDLHLSGQKENIFVQFRDNDFLHSLAKKVNQLRRS